MAALVRYHNQKVELPDITRLLSPWDYGKAHRQKA